MITVVAVLLGYAVLIGVVAPAALARATWPTRAPHLGIAVWLALSLSWLMSVALAGLTLVSPRLVVVLPVELSSVAARVEHGAVAGAGGLWLAVAGAVLLGAVAIRVGFAMVRMFVVAGRSRRRHAAALRLVGRHSPELGAMVLASTAPAAYCLAGRNRSRQIVVTTAALRILDTAQLRALLAHERAHLRGRHHQVLLVARGLRHAFPWLPLFTRAGREVETLVEMAADDAAAQRYDGGTVAAALVGLARSGTPAAALGASGHAVARRVSRMLVPRPPLRLPARAAGAAAAFGAVAFPVAVACVPVVMLVFLLEAAFA